MRWDRLTRLLCAVLLLASACLPTSSHRYRRVTTDDAGGPPPVSTDAGEGVGDAPTARPHALIGVDPPHGPFSGGTLVSLRGNGFASNARVWFGDVEVDASLVTAADPQRVQVTSPPGPAGPVDVVVQNGDDESTRAVLRGGFTYDQLRVEPSSGPTSGGTILSVHASEPIFTEATRIDIDLVPCEVESVESPTLLTCTTPAGTPGSKRVRATVPESDLEIDVLDAFTYVVSDNGFRGGLSGDPLDGSLEVLVIDDLSGLALRDATVIVGEDAETALTATTDRYGTALVTGAGRLATVTVAKHCYQPITFVDVPVDKVTAYLLPALAPNCGGGGGDPPAGGGNPGRGASVSGEVVWRLGGEFRREGFSNVPGPTTPDEHQVAYVFRLATQATDDFALPSAVYAITPETMGSIGYSFSFSTTPGNFTLYALAGIEDRSRSPYLFTTYAVGITRGVVATDYTSRDDIFIEVDVPLDHALSLDARGPQATDRGPDRVEGRIAIEVGGEGYLILPNGTQSAALPVSDPFRFVGMPPLWGSLSGTRYIATARAFTGSAGTMPLSSVGLFASTTEETIGVGAFIEIPRLTAPASSRTWDGTLLRLDREPGGAAADLTIVDIASSGGLVSWRIVAPGAPNDVRVPDLRAIDEELALVRGPIVIQITEAKIDNFAYGAIRYRQLAPRGWRAHAQDAFFANF